MKEREGPQNLWLINAVFLPWFTTKIPPDRTGFMTLLELFSNKQE